MEEFVVILLSCPDQVSISRKFNLFHVIHTLSGEKMAAILLAAILRYSRHNRRAVTLA